MHGLSQNERYLYIYLDYIPGGELFNYLRSIGNLNNDEARFYGAQVTLMFEYLHTKDIIYRDLWVFQGLSSQTPKKKLDWQPFLYVSSLIHLVNLRIFLLTDTGT